MYREFKILSIFIYNSKKDELTLVYKQILDFRNNALKEIRLFHLCNDFFNSINKC
jgi:hypothetical protein